MTEKSNNKPTAASENDEETNNEKHGERQAPGAGSEGEHEDRSSTLEEIFTVFSILLLLGLIGFLGWKSFRQTTPPTFKVQVTEPRQLGEFVAIVVAIRNSGDDTAKAVQVRGQAPGRDGKPIEAEATMDWLPGKSKRRVTLLFPIGTKVDQADVKVVGYEEP